MTKFQPLQLRRAKAPSSRLALIVAVTLGVSCVAPQPESYAQQAQSDSPASRLVIAPATVTLAVGDSVQLLAFEVFGRSDSVPATDVEWRSANNGIATISPGGVTRAVGEGLAGISAIVGERVTVARVIVAKAGVTQRTSQAISPRVPDEGAPARPDPAARAAAPVERPPDPAVISRSEVAGRNPEMPNEPPGYTRITDRHFVSKAANRKDTGPEGSDGWTGGEFRYRNFSIVEDPTAPTGDGRVGQMLYRPNHRAGTGPAMVRRQLPPNLQEVYLSIWAMLSPNWIGNQASINKIFFFGVAGGNNQFIFTAYGSGRNRLQARMSVQGVLDPRSFLRPNLGIPAYVERGQWQRWEFVLKCNSGLNVPDGTADLWLNGVHITSVNNINWTQTKHPTRPCNMNMMNWNPTYGGGGASPGVEQWLRFDRVYISGR